MECKIKGPDRLTRGNDISSSEFIALNSFLEIGKLGGRKYRKQFLNRKEKGRDRKSQWRGGVENHSWPQNRMMNTPEDLDEQVNGLVVGARSSGVRLNADAFRSGRICHNHSLLDHRGLSLLSTFLLCVRTLILRGRRLHQPHILTVFFHPREDEVLLSRISRAHKMAYSLPLSWPALSTQPLKGGITSGLLVLCLWARSQTSPSTAPHACPPPQL